MSADSDKHLFDTIRGRLEATHASAEFIDQFLDGVLAMEKRVWADFQCKGCNKWQRQQVSVPDSVNATKAVLDLFNQLYGTPGKRADPKQEVPDDIDLGDLTQLSDEDLRKLAA